VAIFSELPPTNKSQCSYATIIKPYPVHARALKALQISNKYRRAHSLYHEHHFINTTYNFGMFRPSNVHPQGTRKEISTAESTKSIATRVYQS
jgi:hypothetical protein